MTAATATAGRAAIVPVHLGLRAGVGQALALSRRAVINVLRQPQVFIPSLAFPLLFAALNIAALGRVPERIADTTGLHPFGPEDRYINYLFVATLTQGVLFGSLSGGSELAQDIESGFFDRLIATPVARSSILIGRLAGSAALGVVQALVFMGIFIAFGASVAGGLAGALVLPVVAFFLALAIGSLACAMAIRTGSVEAVQGAFPLLFISIFVSSAFFPTLLMNGWYSDVATHNPITFMIDGMRHQVLYGFDASEAVVAVAVPAGLAAFGIGLCLLALRSKLARS